MNILATRTEEKERFGIIQSRGTKKYLAGSDNELCIEMNLELQFIYFTLIFILKYRIEYFYYVKLVRDS